MSSDPLLLAVLLVVPLIPTFWAIMDVPKRRFAATWKKVVWFLLVSTFPFFGAVFYFIFARRHTEPISG